VPAARKRGRHKHSDGLPGDDGIGHFTLCVHDDPPGYLPLCVNCKQESPGTIKYRDGLRSAAVGLMQRWKISAESTMLKVKFGNAAICLSCWPRFQRQVTHIVEKQKARAMEGNPLDHRLQRKKPMRERSHTTGRNRDEPPRDVYTGEPLEL
jgi:hypothetical protein